MAGGAATVIYQHTDALGSPVATTNSAKAVLQRSEYEPYGYLLNRPIEDGPGYTGHVTDAATGLVYMQQRYYDPELGEFPSTDQVTPFSPGGAFNRYWYANANPYRMVDPDGRTPNEVYLASGGDWGSGQTTNAGKKTGSNTKSQSTDSDSGHFYQFTVRLCKTNPWTCTPQLMMSLGLKGAAPTANGQDVIPEKKIMLPMYPGGPNANPIIQHLDWGNTTIVNVALPGHVFAGYVTHQFYESGGSVYETTTGVGNSGSWIREQANLMVGYVYFRGIYQIQLVLRAQQATMQP